MDHLIWIALFIAQSLFWKWIVSWGGAEYLEGWKAFFVLDWFAARWSAEQIRLYALACWILSVLWFLVGLFIPDLRLTMGT